MKKTTCIQLVLITAALAACERPLYLQGPDYPGAYDPGPYSPGPSSAPMGDLPDSTNSCPIVRSALPPDYYLWYDGFRPFDYYYGDEFNIDGFYRYRYPATVVRAGFGHIAYGRVGGMGHA